mmetsp:Transcript_19994/g.50109  ORF Transcript_19994/g.50109 Transcript_19994/m.50109 type:complete len:260 (+) Transcript_19994:368-1147(+)
MTAMPRRRMARWAFLQNAWNSVKQMRPSWSRSTSPKSVVTSSSASTCAAALSTPAGQPPTMTEVISSGVSNPSPSTSYFAKRSSLGCVSTASSAPPLPTAAFTTSLSTRPARSPPELGVLGRLRTLPPGVFPGVLSEKPLPPLPPPPAPGDEGAADASENSGHVAARDTTASNDLPVSTARLAMAAMYCSKDSSVSAPRRHLANTTPAAAALKRLVSSSASTHSWHHCGSVRRCALDFSLLLSKSLHAVWYMSLSCRMG